MTFRKIFSSEEPQNITSLKSKVYAIISSTEKLSFTITDFPPKMVATHLTILDSYFLCQIPLEEYLRCESLGSENTPNLFVWANRFLALRTWFASFITQSTQLADDLRFLFHVLEFLYKFRNFNSLKAILEALLVNRMGHTIVNYFPFILSITF